MTGHETPRARTLLEMLWDELDAKLDVLMADGEPEPALADSWTGEDVDNYAEWGRQQGRCEGLAYAIAVITNPYQPNVPAIKAEALRRWEASS
jgi:hypothetical protein